MHGSNEKMGVVFFDHVPLSAGPQMSDPDLKAQIAHERYAALDCLGAGEELLSIIGSYGDTLDDDDVLALLKHWNAPVVPHIRTSNEGLS